MIIELAQSCVRSFREAVKDRQRSVIADEDSYNSGLDVFNDRNLDPRWEG